MTVGLDSTVSATRVESLGLGLAGQLLVPRCTVPGCIAPDAVTAYLRVLSEVGDAPSQAD
jgi:hypothetical protein